MIITNIVHQHVVDGVALYSTRLAIAEAPHVTLRALSRLDLRLAAHLDGLSVAGAEAWPFCEAALEVPSAGAAFTATVRAVEERRQDWLEQLFGLAEAEPEAGDGITSGLCWLERGLLQGVVAGLLGSTKTPRRAMGITACAAHGVDPGPALLAALRDPNLVVRARACRAAGELGRRELLSASAAAVVDDEPEGQFWAAWSAVLLGDRGRALDSLTTAALAEHPHRARAFRLALQAMAPAAAHATLQRLGGDPAQIRWLIQGSGVNGDPTYVPWLIRHMADKKLARLAGESFTLITGADLDSLQLWRERPQGVEAGPTDNPEDENVEMDPDEGLMWPDAGKVTNWWEKNRVRFQPGARYFMGAPGTREHCIQVLKDGYQRQRILAAHYLCLLEPGTPLFNTSAPAWRQQKLLAQMA